VEPYFVQEHLLFGAMTWSLKARDLLADSRCVLHSAATRPDAGESELKLYGRASEVLDQVLRQSSTETWWAARPPEDARVFSLDYPEVCQRPGCCRSFSSIRTRPLWRGICATDGPSPSLAVSRQAGWSRDGAASTGSRAGAAMSLRRRTRSAAFSRSRSTP
jgi:hypothetical protein